MRRLEHKKDSNKWHLRYLKMAELVAQWSKHPQFQVGAVAVGDFGQILSTGYNGWPRGVVNEEDGRATTNSKGYSLSIHAEVNLVYNTNLIGTSLKGSTVYVYPLFPCLECSKALVQVGICKIVYLDHKASLYQDQRWVEQAAMARDLFRETGVEVLRIDD